MGATKADFDSAVAIRESEQTIRRVMLTGFRPDFCRGACHLTIEAVIMRHALEEHYGDSGRAISQGSLAADGKNRSAKWETNHSITDSPVVPQHGTDWTVLSLTSQMRRDAVLFESCGRDCVYGRKRPC